VALTWTTVSFWMKIWMEVPSLSFLIVQVPFAIQNEPHGAKNKKIKPHVPKRCLTLFFLIAYASHIFFNSNNKKVCIFICFKNICHFIRLV
jgi:hypothetical protein